MTEPRERTYQWSDPQLLIDGARGLSGLAFLRKMLDGSLPQAPMSATLSFRLVAVEGGFARFEGTPGEAHFNPFGTVHGGWASTLLESAAGCAVISVLDEHSLAAAAQLSVNLTRPMAATTGRVTCEGRIIQAGKRVATAEARLTDEKGALLAHGTTTCVVFPRPR